MPSGDQRGSCSVGGRLAGGAAVARVAQVRLAGLVAVLAAVDVLFLAVVSESVERAAAMEGADSTEGCGI